MLIDNNHLDKNLNVDLLWPEVEKHIRQSRSRLNSKLYRTVLWVICCNLSEVTKGEALVIPLANYIRMPERYNKYGLYLDAVNEILAALSHLSYVKVYKGKKGAGATAVIPQDRFYSVYPYLPKIVVAKSEFVVLKDIDKNLKDYKDTKYTRMSRILTESYNRYLSNVCVEHNGVRLNNKYFRIFNKDFTKGGRYFKAGILNLKSEERLNVTINGSPVVEIDYKYMHIALLLATKGESVDYDPYGFCEDRKSAKKVLNIVLNARDITTASLAITKEIKAGNIDKGLTPSEYITEACRANPQIESHFFSDDGLWCMFLESEVITDVISTCLDLDIPILTIHDGVLCRECDKNVVARVMSDSFKEYFDNQNLQVWMSVESREDMSLITKGYEKEYDNKARRVYSR